MGLEGQLLGPYRLIRIIGQGGMGEVYLAEDTRIMRQVAVKVVRNERQPYPDANAVQQADRLFQREMKAVSRLDHPHILSFYDFGEQSLTDGTLVYMVMPYRPEGSLVAWLLQLGNTLLPPRDVVLMIGQAASALQHAHDNQIIHQDVKPSNFLLRHSEDHPERPDLLLVDFGIAKIVSGTSLMSNSVRGTHSYMAPEQWTGGAVAASDQYALAIMTYQLLTGQLPFKGRLEQIMYQHLNVPPRPLSELRPQLSPAIDAVVLRVLAKMPGERFPTIKAYSAALQQALDYVDLRATLAVSRTEAQQGGNRTITLPGRRQANVMIPAEIVHGQVLTLPGLGMPYYDGGPNGPLLLTLNTAQTDAIPRLEDTNLPTMFMAGSGTGLPTVPADPSAFQPQPTMPPPHAQEWTEFAARDNAYLNQGAMTAPPPFAGTPSGPVPTPLPPVSDAVVPASFAASGRIILEPPPQVQPPPFGPPYVPEDNRNRRSPWRVTIIALLVLLLIGGGAFGVIAVNNTITTNNTHATATAQSNNANATSTAQAQNTNSTATAQAQTIIATATAAAQATQSANARNVDPYAGGSLAFVDPLSQVNHWNNQANQNFGGQCQFTNGSYQISQSISGRFYMCLNNTSFSNLAFEVKLTIVQGDCGGVTVRTNSAYSNIYYFQICTTGSYRIIKYISNSGSDAVNLAARGSMTINQGAGQQNTLGVVANGSSLALYVNDVTVDSVTDSAYTQGFIGLFANSTNNSTTVTFQDARAWTL